MMKNDEFSGKNPAGAALPARAATVKPLFQNGFPRRLLTFADIPARMRAGRPPALRRPCGCPAQAEAGQFVGASGVACYTVGDGQWTRSPLASPDLYGGEPDRKSAVEGKSRSVRVESG